MAEERQSTKSGEKAGARASARPLAGARKINELVELLGDLIEATGLVTADKLAQARSDAGASGSLVAALTEKGVIPAARVAEVRASHFHLPLISLSDEKISPDAVASIPIHVLERVVALPYKLSDNRLLVAIADPSDVTGVDELRLATQHHVELGVASSEEILEELQGLLRANENLHAQSAALEDVEVVDENAEIEDLEADDGISDAPLVRLVNALVIRYRVDGVLQEVQRVPRRMATGVTTRLKVLAKLDIAERRKPQDGRISLNAKAAGRMLDIRVAVLPTVEGECVVMRLIAKSRKTPTLEGLGQAEALQRRCLLGLVDQAHHDAFALDRGQYRDADIEHSARRLGVQRD